MSPIRAADPAVHFEGGTDRGDNFGAGLGADHGGDRQREVELGYVDCTLVVQIEADRVGAAGQAWTARNQWTSTPLPSTICRR